ncbi:MAG: hypothetical protein KDD06_17065 [Phaeodactylibacter sp.]|nr:hypothetical protein [Phaeodactylibacter sp.]
MFNRIQGFYDAEELRIRSSWEQTRWQTAAMLNVYAKKGQKIKPADLVRFPWEDAEEETHSINMAVAEQRWAKWDEDVKKGK